MNRRGLAFFFFLSFVSFIYLLLTCSSRIWNLLKSYLCTWTRCMSLLFFFLFGFLLFLLFASNSPEAIEIWNLFMRYFCTQTHCMSIAISSPNTLGITFIDGVCGTQATSMFRKHAGSGFQRVPLLLLWSKKDPMHKFCLYYTFLFINPFFFAGVHESTRVFLSRSSNCASSMHLLQHLLVCSGLFKKNPLNHTPNSGHPSIPYRNLSKEWN